MSDADKIARLEELLQRKEDEIKAKEKSFAEALERETAKHKEREAKDAAKREELNERVLKLTDERSGLASQLETLKEQEEEFRKMDANLKDLKRENGQLRVNHAEERQNLIEQRDDKRRQADKAQQELADVRCQLSILDHKYQHAVSKQSSQDTQAEEMSKAHLSMKELKERLEDTQREQETEAARFSKDRKNLEDRIAKLQAELAKEREGLTKVDLTARYQTIISAKNALLAKALYCAARTGGPLVPRDVDDDDAVASYLDRAQKFADEQEAQAQSVMEENSVGRRRGHSPLTSNSPSPLTVNGVDIHDRFSGSIATDLEDFVSHLERIPEERQASLLRRFNDSVIANVANSRRFAERSGFPSHKEDPLVLVNHIANLTAERDALLLKVKDRFHIRSDDTTANASGLTTRQASMRIRSSASPDPVGSGAVGSVHRQRLVSSAGSPPAPGTRSRSPVTGRRMWK